MRYPQTFSRRHIVVATAAGLMTLAAPTSAQRGALPPVRQVGAVTARAKDSILVLSQLIPLSDGRVVINDGRRKRLYILDSTLSNPVVIADTSSETNKAYGASGGAALYSRADTVLYVDAAASAMLVISPAGKIVRVMSFPSPSQARLFALATITAGIDPKGQLIYRPFGGTMMGDPTTQDSAVILRSDVASHVTDTVGYVRYDKSPGISHDAEGNPVLTPPVLRPFPLADAWQLLSDGTVAFIRAQGFGIDWVDPDGTRRSTPRIAHEWLHLLDTNKVALVDSLRVYYQAHPMHQEGVLRTLDGQSHPFSRDVMPILPDPSSLPDYLPAFTTAVKADNDAHLWIPEAPVRSIVPLPPGTASTPEPVTYDVVDRLGVMVDRVQIPGGTSIAGFGPGVVYLQSRVVTFIGLVRVRLP